jgi:hypothetical protein
MNNAGGWCRAQHGIQKPHLTCVGESRERPGAGGDVAESWKIREPRRTW